MGRSGSFGWGTASRRIGPAASWRSPMRGHRASVRLDDDASTALPARPEIRVYAEHAPAGSERAATLAEEERVSDSKVVHRDRRLAAFAHPASTPLEALDRNAGLHRFEVSTLERRPGGPAVPARPVARGAREGDRDRLPGPRPAANGGRRAPIGEPRTVPRGDRGCPRTGRPPSGRHSREARAPARGGARRRRRHGNLQPSPDARSRAGGERGSSGERPPRASGPRG